MMPLMWFSIESFVFHLDIGELVAELLAACHHTVFEMGRHYRQESTIRESPSVSGYCIRIFCPGSAPSASESTNQAGQHMSAPSVWGGDAHVCCVKALTTKVLAFWKSFSRAGQ